MWLRIIGNQSFLYIPSFFDYLLTPLFVFIKNVNQISFFLSQQSPGIICISGDPKWGPDPQVRKHWIKPHTGLGGRGHSQTCLRGEVAESDSSRWEGRLGPDLE